MLPDDPLGRDGPNLDEFLSFPGEGVTQVFANQPRLKTIKFAFIIPIVYAGLAKASYTTFLIFKLRKVLKHVLQMILSEQSKMLVCSRTSQEYLSKDDCKMP